MSEAPRASMPAERRTIRTVAVGASALLARVPSAARRVASRPDWPLASALGLGLAAVVETLLRTGLPVTSDGSTALLLNLLATVPLALRRRQLPAVAVVVTAATFATVSSTQVWTVAGLAGQVTVLYLVAARYPRRVLLLVAAPFLLVALGTSGQGAAVSGALLLVLAGAALALGDASRLRGQALAERDKSRRAMADALRAQAAVQERARIARELHATQPDIAVVGTASDGAEAVRLCRERHPDLVLMDVRMPGTDGIEATRQLAADGDGPRVLVLTTFDLDEYVYDALAAGASGFLLKDVTAERLFEAVRLVAAGEALLAPAVTRRLIGEFARLRPRRPQPPEPLSSLTARETEVLRLLAEALSNAEIAERLVVSEETVKTHVSRVLGKLGLRDRSQAIVVAYESGLVTPRRQE